MIYGDRVRQVRELFGWTQKDVATQAVVKQPFVAQIESGKARAPDNFMRALVFRSRFPLQFFEQPPADVELPLGSLMFRAKASMREREQKAVRTHASMAHEFLHRMMSGRQINSPPIRIPSIKDDPELAATVARSELGLAPRQPIKHVLHAMESAGVVVIGLPRSFEKGDAFCAWVLTEDGERRPIVVLSADVPADRLRLSAAHELGHLVMHQPLPASPAIHAEADRFAGAFLLPADAMQGEVTRPVTLETFLNIKLKWGTSVQAGIMRAFHLGLISERKYHSLFRLLSARGWRLREPLSNRVPLEKPRIIRQIAEMVFGRRLNYAEIAQQTAYPEGFVRELLESHAGRDQPTTKPVAAHEQKGSVVEFRSR